MKKLISFIFPIYNEEGNIDLLYKTILDVFKEVEDRYKFELIFVNDGSYDKSLEMLIALNQKDSRAKLVSFSRNFGHQMAITAGIDFAKGDLAIIMDADMQDPPKVALELLKKWEEGYEVVYAQRRNRQDTIFKKYTAYLFYRTLNRLADINIPVDTGDFRLIDRKVIDTIKKFKENNRFMRGLFSYVGFKQAAVLFDRDKRHAGTTKYPFRKMLKFAMDGITNFSTVPLQLITQIGFLISFLSFLGMIYALVMRIFFPELTVSGWTLLIISVLFTGGMTITMNGILGIYIGKIYKEVQNRPLYIVDLFLSDEKNTDK